MTDFSVMYTWEDSKSTQDGKCEGLDTCSRVALASKASLNHANASFLHPASRPMAADVPMENGTSVSPAPNGDDKPATPNVLEAVLGSLLIKPWYPSFYPEELVGRKVERLYVCQWCFKYTKELTGFIKHLVSTRRLLQGYAQS